MITITSCAVAVLYMTGQNPNFASVTPVVLMLGIMMVAAPGVPGGGVMTAIGLLESMLGFNESMIALATIATFTERISKMLGVDPTAGISDEDIEKAEAISA